jgi:hypothetical protein
MKLALPCHWLRSQLTETDIFPAEENRVEQGEVKRISKFILDDFAFLIIFKVYLLQIGAGIAQSV